MFVKAIERGHLGCLREPGDVFQVKDGTDLGGWMVECDASGNELKHREVHPVLVPPGIAPPPGVKFTRIRPSDVMGTGTGMAATPETAVAEPLVVPDKAPAAGSPTGDQDVI